MKSLYKRQFMLMAGVIVISFALLGGAFVTLSYQYAVQEKRDSLGDNAKYIAQSFMRSLSTASTTLGQQNDYAVNIDTLAKVSDSYVIVTETDGLIFYSSDGSDGSNLAGGAVPSYMVSQVAATGSYSGMTDLGGIFPEKRFVAGTPILVQTIDFKTGQGLVVQDKLFGMVNPMSLTAAKAAYDKGGAWHEELKQYLDANFAFVKDFFDKNLPDAVMYIPEATYLAWVDLSKCLPDVEDLPDFFANKAGVLLEGGNSLFVGNAAGYIRLNLAMPRSILKTGLERMRDTINAHNKH